MVQDSVARMVDDKVLPVIQEAFENHQFPRELIDEVAALGLLGSSIEGYDCAGLSSVCYGLICQELERGDSGLRSFVSVQSSPGHVSHLFLRLGRTKTALASRDGKGRSIGCFGLTESQGGSDPSNMKTHAKRDGDD